MNVKKTDFCSFCINGIAEGCKYCVKGEKLVLFISGKCSRDCYYCSLSDERKNVDNTFANERPCLNVHDAIEEARANNASGAGITGGDPLLFLDRTIEYASALKKEFGNEFHIHIYLPFTFCTKEKLEKLKHYVDEVRFHSAFLIKEMSSADMEKEKEILRCAKDIFGKDNVGIELPIFPDKKDEILNYIKSVGDLVGFVNLNELEISDTNIKYMDEKYGLGSEDYTIPKSLEAGKWILRQLARDNSSLKAHLCTAETKLNYQYKNRLLKYNILPFGKRTKDGTVIYLAIYAKSKEEYLEVVDKLRGKEAFGDENKMRIIISGKLAEKINKDYKIIRVEEYPTFDRIEVEVINAN